MPRLRKPGLLVAALAALVLCGLAVTRPAQARVHGLRTGFTDASTFQFADQPSRALALQRAKAAGASIIRLTFFWSKIEPDRPPSDAAAVDPSWAGYDWSQTDAVIRDTVDAGLTPLFEVNSAPGWAEGPGRPPVSPIVPGGSWRPSPLAFQQFAQAAATRYSGHFPDPARPGHFLPRVRYWQGWNEPNLAAYISPQWVQVGNTFVPESPNIYRALLNGWYTGIKAADRRNVVVTAGTSPFGDLQPGGLRMAPALFVRQLFCLNGTHKLRKFACPDSPVRFDVLDHHPYPVGPPRRHAVNADDVSLPDFARLSVPLKAAVKLRTVAPHRHKQLWATEFSWDSNPPDPGGIPAKLEARYMEGAFSELRSEGVSVALWYLMRDQDPDPTFSATLQSGIFFTGSTLAADTPKPSYTSFSFPFTAYLHRGVAELWGLAPRPGRVAIQIRRRGRWRTLVTLRARRGDRQFLAHRKVPRRAQLRARQGRKTSVVWPVFSPS